MQSKTSERPDAAARKSSPASSPTSQTSSGGATNLVSALRQTSYDQASAMLAPPASALVSPSVVDQSTVQGQAIAAIERTTDRAELEQAIASMDNASKSGAGVRITLGGVGVSLRPDELGRVLAIARIRLPKLAPAAERQPPARLQFTKEIERKVDADLGPYLKVDKLKLTVEFSSSGEATVTVGNKGASLSLGAGSRNVEVGGTPGNHAITVEDAEPLFKLAADNLEIAPKTAVEASNEDGKASLSVGLKGFRYKGFSFLGSEKLSFDASFKLIKLDSSGELSGPVFTPSVKSSAKHGGRELTVKLSASIKPNWRKIVEDFGTSNLKRLATLAMRAVTTEALAAMSTVVVPLLAGAAMTYQVLRAHSHGQAVAGAGYLAALSVSNSCMAFAEAMIGGTPPTGPGAQVGLEQARLALSAQLAALRSKYPILEREDVMKANAESQTVRDLYESLLGRARQVALAQWMAVAESPTEGRIIEAYLDLARWDKRDQLGSVSQAAAMLGGA